MFCVLAYPTNMTWWAFMLAVIISTVFSLPIGIIQAVTNTQIGLNVLTEFVYGYIQPGRPLALMMYAPDLCYEPLQYSIMLTRSLLVSKHLASSPCKSSCYPSDLLIL